MKQKKEFGLQGWERTENGWQFAFSDCVIDENGVNYHDSGEKFALGFEGHIQEGLSTRKNDFLQLINIIQKAPEILYPVFASNISALLYPIWEHEEMGSVLWIYGESGSGKTELAMTLGTYVDREKRRSQSESLFSANAKTRNMIEKFQLHRGINFILDDARKERVPGQKNKLLDNIETVVRSVYSQHLTDEFVITKTMKDDSIYAGAIITGEIIDVEISTKARILFIEVKNFINTKVGGEAISLLQKNPEWLAGTMAGIIQYLCSKWNKEGGAKKYLTRFEMLSEQAKENFYSKQIGRLAHSCALQKLAHEIFYEYASSLDCSCDLQFQHLQNAVHNVENMLLTKEDVLWEALEKTLPDLHIELAKLYLAEECEKWERERECLQFGFLLKKDYDGLYFPNISEVPGFEKNWGSNELLLVKKEIFFQHLNEKLRTIMKKRNMQSNSLLLSLPTHLREQKVILVKPRSDRSFNNQCDYYCYEEPKIAGRETAQECCCLVLNLANEKVRKAINLENNSQEIEVLYVRDADSWEEKQCICASGYWRRSQTSRALRQICLDYM